MADFTNILVGVDLSRGDWLASADGNTPSHFACDQAIALAVAAQKAGTASPKIHFLASLDLDERTRWLLEQSPDDEQTVLDQAHKALLLQVACASKAGVESDCSVVIGNPRTVLVEKTAENDLVMTGSRGHGLLAGMLLGSTSIALLSHSTAPVWVVKPCRAGTPRRIMVSTDFSPVCNKLLDHGVKLAKLFNAELHISHVVEEAKRPFLQFSQVKDEAIAAAHEKAIGNARGQLSDLAARPDVASLSKPAVIHLTDGVPSNVVADQTRVLGIDLLLMGTVAWAGVPGMIVGSTAHKMLATLECSLLTMRPPK